MNENWSKDYSNLELHNEEVLGENHSLVKMLNFVGTNKRVIDFGCASGSFAQLLTLKGCIVTGVEINSEAAKLAEKYCQQIIIADLDFVSLQEILPDQHFDVAIFGDVLEHLRNPWQILKETKNLLKADGYVVASIPNIAHASIRLALLQGKFEYSELGILDNTHLRFFTRKTVEELFDKSGYLIELTDRTILPIFTDNPLIPQVYKHEFNLETIQKLEADEDAQTLQFIIKAASSSIEEKYALLREQHSKLTEKQQELLSDVQSIKGKLEESQSQLEYKQAELEQLQSQLKHKQAELGISQVKLYQIQIELQREQSKLEHKQTELELYQTELRQSQKLLQQSELQLQQIQTELQREQTTIKAMESSKFWKLRSRWFGLREFLGLSAKDKTFQENLLIRIKHFWNIYRARGLSYAVNKVLQKSVGKLKNTPVPSHALPNIPQSNDINYQKWLNINYPTPEILKEKVCKADNFTYQPLISLIMPVFNTPERFLREAIESVLNQVYSQWELCIADDASSDNKIKQILEEYSAKDSRIKVVFRTENGHISRCSNSALEIATGEFVALFDHDDLLTPDALYEFVSLLNEHPEADMIYSDEDKIDDSGKLRDPFFKPDWCPDSFLSRMYTCHLGVYRREIITAIGGFREGYEGSQDYDLVLRFTEKTNNIFHIPKILYHWRIHSESAASKPDAKPYAAIAAEKALADTMQRRGEEGQVTQAGSLVGHYIIRYKISEYKLVSIIIPTRDLGDTLDKCLTSIFEKTSYPNYEVILIDNHSKEQKTAEVFAKWQQKQSERFKCYQYDIPFNYSKINNYGVDKARGDYLLFLNNDTEILTSDWIDAMVEQAQRNPIGAVGARLLYPDNTIQHAGVVMGIGGVANHSHKHFSVNSPGYFGQIMTVNNYSAVTAACLMCRREVFEAVGGFEEQLKVAFNDVDFCLKIAEQGYRNIYLPQVTLYHYESKSRGYEDTPEKLIRFNQEVEYMQDKWKEFIENDPCYNPNLSKKCEDFSIEI